MLHCSPARRTLFCLLVTLSDLAFLSWARPASARVVALLRTANTPRLKTSFQHVLSTSRIDAVLAINLLQQRTAFQGSRNTSPNIAAKQANARQIAEREEHAEHRPGNKRG